MEDLTVRRPVVAFLAKRSDEGAPARIAHALARGFESLGLRYDAVFLDDPRGISGSGLSREVRLGACRASRSTSLIRSYLRWASPDVALVGSSFLAPFAVTAGLIARRAVVPWEPAFLRREVKYLRPRDRFIPLSQRLSYRWAPLIAAVSCDVGTELIASLGGSVPRERLFILPNPVDGEEVRRLSAPVASRSGRLRICAVGRLAAEKGHEILLRAVSRADSQLGPWELLVVGDGPKRRELECLSTALGLAKAVKFVGHLPNPFPLVASADIFVHAAHWEGCSLALIEALNLGIPVLATDSPGGTGELLAGGKFGLLVSPGDPSVMADALVRLASDSGLRRMYSEAGPARAADFSPEQIARRILLLVNAVRRNGRP